MSYDCNSNQESLMSFVERSLQIKDDNPLIEEKRQVDKGFSECEKKSLLRYVFIIVDTTHTCTKIDFKPSRIGITQIYLKNFLRDFFDKNPLSVVAMANIHQSQCITLQDFTSSLSVLDKKIEELQVDEKYEFSLFECLNEVFNVFSEAPHEVVKEVILIQSTPITKDKGDIFSQIKKAVDLKLTFNIISLNSKTYVFSLTQQTKGRYDIALNEKDFEKLMNSYCEQPRYVENKTIKTLIQVGIPRKKYTNQPYLCTCHMEQKTHFYICPQCACKNCEVPSKCVCCELYLILPLHITKSHQIRTDLREFDLCKGRNDRYQAEIENSEQTVQCSACFSELVDLDYSKCRRCNCSFCLECDILIHKQKIVCPKCHEDPQ